MSFKLFHIAVAIIRSLVLGFLLCILWNWFMAQPLNLPPLHLPNAMGFSMFFNLLIYAENSSATRKMLKREHHLEGNALEWAMHHYHGFVFIIYFICALFWYKMIRYM